MSQNKPDKVRSVPPRNIVGAPVEHNGNARALESDEVMEVEPGYNPEMTTEDSQDNTRSPDPANFNQDERLRDWFNVSGGGAVTGTQPPSSDQPTDMMEGFDAEDEASATGLVEARFENISRYKHAHHKADTRICGGSGMIRCLPWKILVIFHPPDSSSMGFFVQCNADSDSQTWSCSAKATLILVAQQPNCKNKEMKIQHTFTHKENDWGFQTFMTFEELFNPEKGYIGTNDSIVLQARVKADAPHGADWDSKRHTGFVGLKNQGATCYLNSLLQALYCTNKLRRAVFLMPTESDDAQTSVPLALQRVFYELQFSDRAVGTKKLTRSFGWATLDSFMQHDAQELCRVLLDNLENKMKGTSVEDVIPGLFCGKMMSYIRCLNVRYESKREENFYDIQLKVNGNRSIYDAFSEYVAKETLTQDNKYDAGEYGLQEAEKGVSFIRFPPVLYLQLMRFQYDFVADTNVKINDRFEFMYTLQLDDYLLQPDPASPANYFLHAVLVHSGDNHGGHYVVYINPAGNNVWYQFDDDVVSRCSARDAIYMNFGGTEDPDMRPCTNAYMLVYIAESARADVLCPLSMGDIPESLRERFIEEQTLEEAKRLDKERGHLFMVIYLVLEEDFHGWQGPELCSPELLPNRILRVPKQTTRTQLVENVAKYLNHTSDSVRLWHFRPRRKNMPTHLLELNDSPLQSTAKDLHIFFVQCSLTPPALPQSPTAGRHLPYGPEKELGTDRRLFFIKYFDSTTWSMHFCGVVPLYADDCLASLEPAMRQRAGLPPDCPLVLYQDDSKAAVTEATQIKTPVSRLFKREQQGQLIYFQRKPENSSITSSLVNPEYSEMDNEALSTPIDDASTVVSSVTLSDSKPSHPVDSVNGLNTSTTTTASPRPDLGTLSGKGEFSPMLDPTVLHRMAALPNVVSAKQTPANQSPGVTHQPLSPAIHGQALVPGDPLSIFNYFANFLHQVDILLVDKMRSSDPGIMLRVASDLTYWDFVNVVAAHLSTSNDRIQLFRSQQILGGTINTVSAPISVSPNVVGSEMSASPVGSDLGSGGVTVNTGAANADSASPGSRASNMVLDPVLSPLTVTARAAGFSNYSLYMNNLLVAAAAQGLAQEPPGAAISSTHQGSMREVLLPFSVSPANSLWTSDTGGVGPGMVTGGGAGGGNLTAGAAGANSAIPDRFPVPLNRYCGVKTVNRSPLGSVTFPPPRRVYYAHLALRIQELETMRQVRVVYVCPKLTVKAELLLSVPQNGLVHDLLKEARRRLSLPTEGSGQLRLFEVSANRIVQQFPASLKLSSIPQSTLLHQSCISNPPVHSLRIEEIPMDEVNLKPDETIVYVSHFDKELHETFGVPFTVRIREGECYSAVRERIRRRLEVPEKEFERWRFAVMLPTEATYIPNDEDTVVRIKIFTQTAAPEYRPWLGIEHKPSKRPRYAPNEKPIKIHN